MLSMKFEILFTLKIALILLSFRVNSEVLILCSAICVHSATRHNIHMYPYFLFAAIHHLNRRRLSRFYHVAQAE